MGAVTEEGLQHILETYFATPGDFYVGLCSDTTIAKDAVYTDLTLVSGSGYALIALSAITVALNGTDDRKATGNEVTFEATGDWTSAASYFVITPDVTSGTFILLSWDTLSEAVSLVNGGFVAVTPIFYGNS